MLGLTHGDDGGEILRPWDRLEAESPQAYGAFEEYCRLGSGRSLSKLSAKLGKSTGLLSRWSFKHDWVRRAAAWSHHESAVINTRIIEGRASARERQIVLAAQLQVRAQSRILRMSEKEIDGMSPSEVAALLRVSADLDRRAREFDDGELGFSADLPVPQFTIQIINLPSLETHARVQMEPGGQPGVVAREHLERFKADFPDAVVIA